MGSVTVTFNLAAWGLVTHSIWSIWSIYLGHILRRDRMGGVDTLESDSLVGICGRKGVCHGSLLDDESSACHSLSGWAFLPF